MRNILVIDVETGGLDPNVHSILTIGAVAWKDGAIADTISIQIAEPEIVAEAGALKVNGLDVDELRKTGVGVGNAVDQLETFIAKNNMRQKSPVTIAAHNVQFDYAFLKRLYRLAGRDFTKKFSHRTVCTQTLAYALVLANRLPLVSVAGDKVFAHFRCSPERVDGKHEALGDAIACAKALTAMLNMLRAPSVVPHA